MFKLKKVPKIRIFSRKAKDSNRDRRDSLDDEDGSPRATQVSTLRRQGSGYRLKRVDSGGRVRTLRGNGGGDSPSSPFGRQLSSRGLFGEDDPRPDVDGRPLPRMKSAVMRDMDATLDRFNDHYTESGDLDYSTFEEPVTNKKPNLVEKVPEGVTRSASTYGGVRIPKVLQRSKSKTALFSAKVAARTMRRKADLHDDHRNARLEIVLIQWPEYQQFLKKYKGSFIVAVVDDYEYLHKKYYATNPEEAIKIVEIWERNFFQKLPHSREDGIRDGMQSIISMPRSSDSHMAAVNRCLAILHLYENDIEDIRGSSNFPKSQYSFVRAQVEDEFHGCYVVNLIEETIIPQLRLKYHGKEYDEWLSALVSVLSGRVVDAETFRTTVYEIDIRIKNNVWKSWQDMRKFFEENGGLQETVDTRVRFVSISDRSPKGPAKSSSSSRKVSVVRVDDEGPTSSNDLEGMENRTLIGRESRNWVDVFPDLDIVLADYSHLVEKYSDDPHTAFQMMDQWENGLFKKMLCDAHKKEWRKKLARAIETKHLGVEIEDAIEKAFDAYKEKLKSDPFTHEAAKWTQDYYNLLETEYKYLRDVYEKKPARAFQIISSWERGLFSKIYDHNDRQEWRRKMARAIEVTPAGAATEKKIQRALSALREKKVFGSSPRKLIRRRSSTTMDYTTGFRLAGEAFGADAFLRLKVRYPYLMKKFSKAPKTAYEIVEIWEPLFESIGDPDEEAFQRNRLEKRIAASEPGDKLKVEVTSMRQQIEEEFEEDEFEMVNAHYKYLRFKHESFFQAARLARFWEEGFFDNIAEEHKEEWRRKLKPAIESSAEGPSLYEKIDKALAAYRRKWPRLRNQASHSQGLGGSPPGTVLARQVAAKHLQASSSPIPPKIRKRRSSTDMITDGPSSPRGLGMLQAQLRRSYSNLSNDSLDEGEYYRELYKRHSKTPKVAKQLKDYWETNFFSVIKPTHWSVWRDEVKDRIAESTNSNVKGLVQKSLHDYLARSPENNTIRSPSLQALK